MAEPDLNDPLPEGHRLASPLYQIKSRGGALQAIFTTQGDPGEYALYQWGDDGWQFVPARSEPAHNRIIADEVRGTLALVELPAITTRLMATQAHNQSADGELALALNGIYAEGYTLNDEGAVEGSNQAGIPLVRPASDKAVQAFFQQPLRAQVDVLQGIEGDAFVLAFGPLEEAQHERFITLLQALRDSDVGVWVAAPQFDGEQWAYAGYDWAALGAHADFVVVPVQASPAEFRAGGLADRIVRHAHDHMPLQNVYFATTAMSMDIWQGQVEAIPYDYALAPLGDVGFLPASSALALDPQPGDSLGFVLQGDAQDVTVEPTTGSLTYTVMAGDGPHEVWLNTGYTLHHKLNWLADASAAGIVVTGLLDEGASPTAEEAVGYFKRGEAMPTPQGFSLNWQVAQPDGELVTEQQTTLNEALVWVPESEGEYLVSVAVQAEGQTVEKGRRPVFVSGESIGVVPEFENVVTGSPDLQSEQPTQTVIVNPDLAPPVVQPSAPGNFELGGQVNHVMYHPGKMRQAGMRWVKYQVAWDEAMSADVVAPMMAQADAEGFKVLLSITGQTKYPDSIDYDAYLAFLRDVAYYGPDAIEIWNEGNLAFEWPRGQINGVTYVEEMLAPGYNAIKQVNPNIMVISQALAPTGAFFADGGCSKNGDGCDDWIYLQQMAQAGAANYMDCVGVHFNAGATSPYVNEGHPADPGYQHYSWYFSSMVDLYGGTFGRPICFTELGYLSGDGYGAVPGRFSWAAETSVIEQAQWLAEAAQYSRELGNIRMMIVWNVDFVYWGDDPMAGYAIVRPDGSCPACTTLSDVMR
jgi:hypothetical protein